MRRLILGAALIMAAAAPGSAHDAQLSAIRVLRHTGTENGEVVVSVSMHLSRLAWAEGERSLERDAAQAALGRRLRLQFGGAAFKPREVSLIHDSVNDQVVWQGRGPLPVGELTVATRLIPEDAGASTLVTVLENGQAVQETMLDAEHPSLPAGANGVQGGRSAVPAGRPFKPAGLLALCALLGVVAVTGLQKGWRRRRTGQGESYKA